MSEPRCKNNLQTVQFLHYFKKRNPKSKEKFAGNIKPSLTIVSVELVNECFDSLSKELEGIPLDLYFQLR